MVWENLFIFVLKNRQPLHLVFYEDLVRDPIKEIKKVIKFLELTNGFSPSDLETKLLCLSENLQGANKRKKKQHQINPYNSMLTAKINQKIFIAQNLLSAYNIAANLSSYKRAPL